MDWAGKPPQSDAVQLDSSQCPGNRNRWPSLGYTDRPCIAGSPSAHRSRHRPPGTSRHRLGGNDADFFYKADDDTYAVIENMRYMLYPYNPETPVHFGFKFKPFVKQGYMSGGAGYILSREALRRFVVEGIPNPKMCLPGTVVNEDIEIGRCMEHLNVTAGDSRDQIGRGRMFPFVPEHHIIPAKYDKGFWYWNYQFYKTDDVSFIFTKIGI